MARTRNKMIRVNLSLQEQTIEIADRVWPIQKYRSRSAFVDEATRWYATALQKKRLKDDLIRGLQAMTEEDIKIIAEWEPASAELLEQELVTVA